MDSVRSYRFLLSPRSNDICPQNQIMVNALPSPQYIQRAHGHWGLPGLLYEFSPERRKRLRTIALELQPFVALQIATVDYPVDPHTSNVARLG